MIETFYRVEYAGTNITGDISKDVLSVSYTDNEDGKADDISISLKDPEHKWLGAWMPERGDLFSVTILPRNQPELNCGKVEVDEIASSGPPTVFELKGCSVPIKSAARRVLRTKSWEKITLQDMASQMSKNANLTLMYLVDENPYYQRKDQTEESDLAYLLRLATEEGFSVKVTDEQLVIFEQSMFEQKDPIKTYTLNSDLIKSWSFNQQSFELYKSCTCKYHIPGKRKLIVYTYTDPDIPEGIDLKIRKGVANADEAKRKTRAALRLKNKHQFTGSLTVVGDTQLQAGVTLNVAGFGGYDGKYIVEKATHSVSMAGYITSIDLRRVLTGY